MDWAIASGLVLAAVALFGVFLQAVIYAYREGQKEQRLLAVESRMQELPQIEGLAMTMEVMRTQLVDLKKDLKTDIGEINHIIRNHLMVRPQSQRTGRGN